MDLILFGIQGSGKGTQGKILAAKKGLTYFEMGQELRNIVASHSPTGEKIKSVLEAGNLVDDDLVMAVIKSFLDEHDAHQPILFDGIPRTQGQSQRLLSLLNDYGREAYGLLIDINHDEAMKRLLLRARHDDLDETIRRRMANFMKETIPVINSFSLGRRLIEVNGQQPIEAVTQELFNKVSPILAS